MKEAQRLKIADFHCDALSKLQTVPGIDFADDKRLEVTGERLAAGNVALQVFAVYLSADMGRPSFERILGQLSLFRKKVAASSHIEWLRWKEEAAASPTGRIQGLLSLEGADGLEGNLQYAEWLFELGVRFIGLTWNYANWAADGVLESRNGGFTEKGKALVDWCNDSGMLLDVSHLAPAGFWELAERSVRPFIASHSNCRAVCDHPRNLSNEQIQAIIAMGGRMGLTFYPPFVRAGGSAAMADLLRHVEHVCALGGSRHLMFGSDFDGVDAWTKGLEHPGKYPELADLLLRHYPEAEVRGWLYDNALNFLAAYLPAKP
ncbi:dipeptidase [Paenibacillus sp. NFR01]|uniref:dipeptidase n=1 Tax=Paenibacillus sp. NFR01 TaxID=1566279 RepID=UPI0008B98051|nr:dipeptidase [Paenibacillus sp. NFR01]SET41021.1 membrane dipeptidase [Paenibacillus sp. NFR01]